MRRYFLLVMLLLPLWGSETDTPKASLHSDGTIRYLQLPPEVDSFTRMWREGLFYGRLRANAFGFDWREELPGRKDNWAVGLGGSLLYRSAEYRGWSAAAGLYTSQNPWHMADEDILYLKSGKDVTSRYRVLQSGEWGMTVLAQGYVQYRRGPSRWRVGRQIFESFLTRSNDSKMIPNTFEGVTFKSTVAGIGLKAAYLTRQKLRDHTSFHHLLAYGDDPADPYAPYSQNDDGAMHRGLTLSKLQERGIEDRLWVAEGSGSSAGWYGMLNYTEAPRLVASATMEVRRRLRFGSFDVTPGLRYMRQFDRGAGAIGGANLRLDTTGYGDPDSLDGAMTAVRIDLAEGAWRLRLGYSAVADEGDLVAPWRGFPTGGYTRLMGQYNWYAGTRSAMVRFDYDFAKAGLVDGLTGSLRYARQDFDDAKPGVPADSDVYYLDAIERFEAVPGLQAKLRIAVVTGDGESGAVTKSDPSYRECRFELNYLF
ncbi:hypothetical protein [Hydrogenimonas sp.]